MAMPSCEQDLVDGACFSKPVWLASQRLCNAILSTYTYMLEDSSSSKGQFSSNSAERLEWETAVEL